MKAIIMAGGEGSRLRPLTCDRPKPLTPLLDRPVMEHIINLLKKHGITEIGVTLQYLPEAITDYFGDGRHWGINLRYFVEETPLGTAGSVKNAEQFLDETFLVISGDALTDFDLSAAVAGHREKQALATIVLTPVGTPLEYGVVITGDSGAIQRFLEKPSWGEVFSDTVNTGIYVLEPEVLGYFKPKQKFDFSQDLFPLLLKNGHQLFGCVLNGYWCDIGNLNQYTQAHFDILQGKVRIEIPGQEIQPGIWVEPEAEIHPNARIVGPVFLGASCRICDGAQVGPLTVIGRNSLVGEAATLKRSILWNNVLIGQAVQIRGAVLCNGVQIGAKTAVFEGSVVGDESVLQDQCIIKDEVKIWPGKRVEKGTILRQSLVWGTRGAKTLFGLDGYPGMVNEELTPEFAARLGAAFGSCHPRGTKISVSAEEGRAAGMVAQSLIAGLLSTGVEVLDLGTLIAPAARYLAANLGVSGGTHVKMTDGSQRRVRVNFFNSQGVNISKNEERKIENLLAREGLRRAAPDQIGQISAVPRAGEQYLGFLLSALNAKAIQQRRPSLIFTGVTSGLSTLIPGLTEKLGCRVTYLDHKTFATHNTPADVATDFPDSRRLSLLAETVLERGADLGILLGSSGEQLALVDDRGRVVSEDSLQALLALISLKTLSVGRVVVPVTASRAIEELAGRYNAQVIRTKTSLQSLMENCLQGDGRMGSGREAFLMNFDAIYALGRILDYLADSGLPLSSVAMEIPDLYLSKKAVRCPWEAKGTVMRRLLEDHKNDRVELLDGIKVFYDDGWTLVLPDSEEPVCRVYGEGYSMEAAEALTEQLVKKISGIIEAEA